MSVRLPSRRAIVVSVLQSLVVFVAAVAAFAVGAIVTANIVGMPEKADVSGYDFSPGNLPMLVLSLVVIYVVSAFGEEVIFRGFLINPNRGVVAPAAKRRGGWPLCLAPSCSAYVTMRGDRPEKSAQTGFMGLALGASGIFFARLGESPG